VGRGVRGGFHGTFQIEAAVFEDDLKSVRTMMQNGCEKLMTRLRQLCDDGYDCLPVSKKMPGSLSAPGKIVEGGVD